MSLMLLTRIFHFRARQDSKRLKKMKLLVVLCLAAVALAAPQNRGSRQAGNPQDIQLIRYDSVNDGLNSYNYNFEQSDGHKHEEQGELKNPGSENESLAVRGVYSWVGPDGVTYTVTYIADNNGFQPTIEQGPGGGVPPGVVASLLG